MKMIIGTTILISCGMWAIYSAFAGRTAFTWDYWAMITGIILSGILIIN